MTDRQFIEWLQSYLATAQDTQDNVLIAAMLSTTNNSVQTNPYWSTVSTTVGSTTELSYSIVVDPKTNTYSVTNYQQNEDR